MISMLHCINFALYFLLLMTLTKYFLSVFFFNQTETEIFIYSKKNNTKVIISLFHYINYDLHIFFKCTYNISLTMYLFLFFLSMIKTIIFKDIQQ